jgi:hypothetical protein
VSEPRPRVFFRIVKGERPSHEDFMSSLQLCRRPRRAEIEDPLEWAGLSVFDTRAQAEFIARLYRDRGMGQFVAELRIPDASPAVVKVIVLKTRGPGHYLLLGCAETFLPLVVDTRPVGG